MLEKYMISALEESNANLKDSINKKMENWKEPNIDYLIFKVQTETIHWLVDSIERIDKTKITNLNDNEIFSAFKYLNNALKHNVSLTHIDIAKGYISFPLTFPFPNKIIYEWADLSYLTSVRNKSQKKHYDIHLKDKPVIETIDNVINIIKGYMN